MLVWLVVFTNRVGEAIFLERHRSRLFLRVFRWLMQSLHLPLEDTTWHDEALTVREVPSPSKVATIRFPSLEKNLPFFDKANSMKCSSSFPGHMAVEAILASKSETMDGVATSGTSFKIQLLPGTAWPAQKTLAGHPASPG